MTGNNSYCTISVKNTNDCHLGKNNDVIFFCVNLYSNLESIPDHN